MHLPSSKDQPSTTAARCSGCSPETSPAAHRPHLSAQARIAFSRSRTEASVKKGDKSSSSWSSSDQSTHAAASGASELAVRRGELCVLGGLVLLDAGAENWRRLSNWAF
eukprot:TRINITY_DN21496_c0_g1_i2.p1 TRINITY_DN21496_c0_g1~~TRINITY_DN21496_c0_g1_i2.p1  ORF type:complete len:109 (+),score=3.73 TRINITY_DN21496_c0_g1_i2:123-449(+)